jgi:cytoskeletal protein CcmA (bactofilin family)
MLPNFRKNETDVKNQLGLAAGDTPNAFAPRPIFAGPRSGERAQTSVIGPDLIITGNLVTKGEVQIDGKVEGDIHGSHVIVGERANISGGIVSEEVVIRGHVMGSIRSKKVMLQATSQVDGDIFHQSLSIEQGAMFEGKSRRTTDDPRNGAATATTATPPALPQA